MLELTPRPKIYDTYWRFAAERQGIFDKKQRGEAAPWTRDPILQTYKFCNVYRATDRESQFLIRRVIYDKPRAAADTLLRIMLFRLLNRSQTWTALEAEVGEINRRNFNFARYDAALTQLKAKGPIYSNAYILAAHKVYGHDIKHRNHLALLEDVFITSNKGKKLLTAEALEQLYHLLRQLPLMGNFMAYQLAIDFNYSPVFNFSENDFTVPGPGAMRGIAKCFSSLGEASPAEVIMRMVDVQEAEFKRLGLDFKYLGGRQLCAIDCQGLFCEVDKYCRVRFPGLTSNRQRIKTRYTPTTKPLELFLPPKWSVNL